MTINEMVAKRKKLLDAMDGFLETHKNANGVLSKEDEPHTQRWSRASRQ